MGSIKGQHRFHRLFRRGPVEPSSYRKHNRPNAKWMPNRASNKFRACVVIPVQRFIRGHGNVNGLACPSPPPPIDSPKFIWNGPEIASWLISHIFPSDMGTSKSPGRLGRWDRRRPHRAPYITPKNERSWYWIEPHKNIGLASKQLLDILYHWTGYTKGQHRFDRPGRKGPVEHSSFTREIIMPNGKWMSSRPPKIRSTCVVAVLIDLIISTVLRPYYAHEAIGDERHVPEIRNPEESWSVKQRFSKKTSL